MCRLTAHAALRMQAFPSLYKEDINTAMIQGKWVFLVYGEKNRTIKIKPKHWNMDGFMFEAKIRGTQEQRKLRMDKVHNLAFKRNDLQQGVDESAEEELSSSPGTTRLGKRKYSSK